MKYSRITMLLVAVICGLLGCTDESLTTHTSSTQFGTKQEKLDFLERYLVNRAGLLDAEYRIDYQDNGSGRSVPGPSDYDLRMILRILPDSMNAWTSDVERQDFLVSREMWSGVAPDTSVWRVNFTPELYTSQGQVKLIYRTEGIVFAYYTTRTVDIEKYKLEP